MAYNNLSGTVFMPGQFLTRTDLVTSAVLSGNLSTSDAADVINVPRLNNAVADAIVTNVGGDYNTLTTNGNLTFNGASLNVTGDITASVGLSASFLYGDGRFLTNLVGGSGGGIFTQLGDAQAATTSSINVGSLDVPSHTLSVKGNSFLSGGVVHKRKVINNVYTASLTDYFIGVDTSQRAVHVRLPSAATLFDGQMFVVKDEAGSAPTNNITILASGSQTIDGQNSIILESPHASIQLYCDGTNKYFIY